MKKSAVNYKAMIETLEGEIAELGELFEKRTSMGMSGFMTATKLNEKREMLESLRRFAAIQTDDKEHRAAV